VFRDAPGHSDSQLTLHLPDRKLLFAADMLSDVEIPMLDRPPDVYRATLEGLRPLADNGAIETLVPGHGAIARGAGACLRRLREDLAYLDQLEHRTADCVRARRSLDDTIAELDAMDYRGKAGGPFPMRDVHHDNVRIAYRAAHGGA
jgi:glyoxylase-like metal-dependent hydrolase (beta-lactamase superfamily II)